MFELCEVGGSRPIVIVISTAWCGPCHEFASYVSGGPQPGWIPAAFKLAIDRGDAFIVEYLSEDAAGLAPTQAALAAWHQQYPHDHAVVVSDGSRVLVSHLSIEGYPSFAVIDRDYRWRMTKASGMYLDQIMAETWVTLQGALSK